MEEINIIYSYETNKNFYSEPNMALENLYLDLIKKLDRKEPIFVKFGDKHEKRPGAIARMVKIEGEPFKKAPFTDDFGRTFREDRASFYSVKLKWDDRKNVTSVRLNDWKSRPGDLLYLPDYEGPTVWSLFDKEKFAEKHGNPVVDRLGNELKEGDTVVYINARYGTGAELDFGSIKKIDRKAKITHYDRKRRLETHIEIETIATRQNEKVMISKIKKPEQSILKINDIDLFDEAFVRKLIVKQETS